MAAFDINNLSLVKKLGSGSFGDVYQAKDRITNKKYAIKIIDKRKLSSKRIAAVRTEIMILMSVNHPHIVKTYYMTEDEDKYRMYMDLFSGDLEGFHLKHGQFDERNIYIVLRQLVSAVNYLHNDKHIVHGDIKLENILFDNDNDMNVVLADFGLSYRWRDGDPLINSLKGTPKYYAPEIRDRVPYEGYPVDVYALGVVLFNISFPPNIMPKPKISMTIFDYLNVMELARYKRIDEMNISLLPDLIKRMLFPDPNERIKINEIIEHPWMVKMKNL